MLTTDQIVMITIDTMLRKPQRVIGKEAEEFKASLEKDLEVAKKNGWQIEIPFEIPAIG